MEELRATSAVESQARSEWVEVPACPVCGRPNHDPFERAEDNGREITYRICHSCGVVFQSPRMSERAQESYYRADYGLQHQGVTGVTQKELRIQAGRARNLVALLKPQVEVVDRHLDVGSSTGMLMQSVSDEFGSQGFGIEPAELYRDYSTGHGLSVFASLEALAAVDARPFDLITLAHVLEHLAWPVKYLRTLKESWLEPRGRLLVEVPNLFGHQSMEIPHVIAFHAATLARALFEAGYEVIWIVRHGLPRSRLIPLYLTALATPSSTEASRRRPRIWTRGVRLRRAAGMIWHRFATRLAPRRAWLPLPELLDETDRGTPQGQV